MSVVLMEYGQQKNITISSRFLPFVRVQCGIALAAVNRLGEKLLPKNEMIIEKVK